MWTCDNIEGEIKRKGAQVTNEREFLIEEYLSLAIDGI